jgi:hypothetical protein
LFKHERRKAGRKLTEGKELEKRRAESGERGNAENGNGKLKEN